MSPSIPDQKNLSIAVIGAGGIGTGLAFFLANAGHRVTLVARNRRLSQLIAAKNVIHIAKTGEQVQLHAVVDRLDPSVEFDGVFLAVLHAHVPALLPVLQASKAKQIITMFNVFAPLAPLRDALGAKRFVPGFPAMNASVDAATGHLTVSAVGWPIATIVSDEKWAAVLSAAKVPATVEPQTESWRRTHVIVVGLLLTALVDASRQGHALSWSHARQFGVGVREGYHVVEDLGGSVRPTWHAVFGWLQGILFALIVFIATRVPAARGFGADPRALEGPALIGDVVKVIDTDGKGVVKHSTTSLKTIHARLNSANKNK